MGQAATKELTMAQDQVRVLTLHLRQSANQLAATKAELEAAKAAKAGSQKAYGELQAAREKLELMSGELKLAEAEKRAMQRLKGELQGAHAEVEAERRAKELLNAQVIAQANARLKPEEHPVFGALLYDHGYKRVYRASPVTVWAATPIWEKQRAFREARAKTIAKAKQKLGTAGWPGTITVCELLEAEGGDGHAHASSLAQVVEGTPAGDALSALNAAASAEGERLGGGGAAGDADGSAAAPPSASPPRHVVIDGQHRLGAAQVLASEAQLGDSLNTILVEVYPKALFTEINKVQPVKLVDLPLGGATPSDNVIISGAVEELKSRYAAMFKPSPRCRPPHVHEDTLRDELHRARVIERLGLKSPAELFQWLQKVNAERLAKRDELFGAAKSPKALEKAVAHQFVLGMDNGWIRDHAAEADEAARDEDEE